MNIHITTIPHKKQRYTTVGDWTVRGNTFTIKVSRLSDPRYEFLIALHEMLEAYLCTHRGIKQSAIDTFDMKYEHKRPQGSTLEAGDDPQAPYRDEHFTATTVERIVAQALDVDWATYEKEINAL